MLPKGMNEYYGRNVDKMPELLKAGEVPLSMSGIMQLRLGQGSEFPNLWKNWYYTSDLSVSPKGNDEEIYFLLTVDNQGQITENGRKALELIRPDNLVSNSGVVVEQLKDLGGEGLIKVLRSKIKTETYLLEDQILREQVWRIFARHPDEVPSKFAEDEELLRKYVNEVQERSGDKRNMALYVGNPLKDKTILNVWNIDGPGYRSYAGGRLGLDFPYGRLISRSPEKVLQT